jgi:hypothetical protein
MRRIVIATAMRLGVVSLAAMFRLDKPVSLQAER